MFTHYSSNTTANNTTSAYDLWATAQHATCCQSNKDIDTPLQWLKIKGPFLIFPQRPFFFLVILESNTLKKLMWFQLDLDITGFHTFYIWNIYSSHILFFLTFHTFSVFVANTPDALWWLRLVILTVLLSCILTTHVNLFSILSTYSSFFACAEMSLEEAPLKGEMEVEYVSAEYLKSICLWTDGLIDRQWLEQIGSSGLF